MEKHDNLQPINTNAPRETLVYAVGDTVIKKPVPNRMPKQVWMDKQQHAKSVTDKLLTVKNPAYFIPRIEQIYNDDDMRAVEQRANGMPLSAAYFSELTDADKDIIYSALAHFMNDMNQMYPVRTQAEHFDATAATAMATVIKQLSAYIDKKELQVVGKAKEWFDNATKQSASVVFSHGDMNEDNIFYDAQRRIVSFIDFAEAKYENIQYMFENNFGKLSWLDLNRLRKEYMALPRHQPVNITVDPNIEQMRAALQNFIWSATEFLKKPTMATQIFINMIKETIDKIAKLYDRIRKPAGFANGAATLSCAPKATIINMPIKDTGPKR